MSFAYQGRALRALRGLLGLAVALCVSAAGLTTPSRAEEMLPAMVSASAESNYGRLIVGFPERLSLPPHEISTENGVLVIQFDEQIDADVRDVTRALAGYVTVARRDPDGMALRFGLTRGVSINVMEAGEKLFVDFLPANWQGLPPGLPADVVAELAGRAEAAALRAAEEERRRLLGELNAEVALRIGRHPTFSRLSFDWNIPFATTVVREDSTIRVRFNHRVGIDLSELAADLPPLVTKVDALVGDTGLEVIVEVDDEASIRAFEDEQSYIIDVTGPRLTAPDPRLAAIEETLGGAPQPGSITVQGDRVTERPEAADEEMPAAVAETRPADGPFISDMTPEEDATPAARPVLSQARPDVGGTVQVHRRAPEVTRDAATGLNIVRAETIRVGDIIRMSFPFRNETPAAVFTRGRSLFIVFDTIVPIDMRSVRNEAAHLVRDISLTRFDGMTLIRLDLIDSIFATALPEGMRWVVTLGDAVLEPTLPLDIERAARADGRPFAEILAEGLGNVFTFKDEVVGDTIIVATIRPPARGFLKPFNFVEFSTLPSAHGIAILPRADDLRVHKGEEGHLLIEREEGLRLSEVGGSVDEFFFASVERPGFIDMDTLRDSDRGTYYEKRAELEERLSISEGEDRAQRQLDLARLAITYELGPEALGNLEIALDEQPSLEHDPAFLILMGAANVTANRPDMALRYLGDSGLRNNPDAALWRLIAYGQQGDWRAVRRVARRAQQVIDDYPVTVSGPARLTLAEAALDANAIAGVSELLGNINPARLSHDLLAHHIILSALLEDALGRRDAALSMLQQAASMDDGPENARAELERIRIQVRDEIITPQAATEALENLTTGWRGDNTEITARALLARLYVQTGDYRSAFHALKAAVMADSEADAVRELHNEMSAAFTRLFLDGEADSLPTLDALSLFYDFRELTPAGRQG
ncbi:MAG: hypothetical protein KDI98_02130, partial [Hyphomicrobiaceae bacterium]|nr:hypothetical protein [Hyphomicrobiaceae bacterium]